MKKGKKEDNKMMIIVRVQHVDILRKRLPPSNLHCLSKDDELEMDNTRETSKEEKR